MSTDAAMAPRESIGTGRIIRGETQYDRTVSGLIAMILGVASVVGWLFIQYMAMQAFNGPMSAPLEIIEVSGGGGGSLEGNVGDSETIEVPGAAYGAAASNNESNASDFEEPSVAMTPNLVFDGLVGDGESVMTQDLGPSVNSGGAISTGRARKARGGRVMGLVQAQVACLVSSAGISSTIRARRWMNMPKPLMQWELRLPFRMAMS